jgi:hypothetical protein
MISGGGGGGGGGGLTQGTLAARPASPVPGQMYFTTDTYELFLGNAGGSAWQSIGKTTGYPSNGRLAVSTQPGAPGNLPQFGGGGGGGNQNYWLLTDGSGMTMQSWGGAYVLLSCPVDATGYRTTEPANGKQGTATLVAGTVVVANTSVTATSRIFLTCQTPGGTVGALYVSARTAGTSFTITSTSGSDTSTVAYEIFEVG